MNKTIPIEDLMHAVVAKKLARHARAALAGVADYTPRTKTIGWCWCGGSIEHDVACRRAQSAIAALDLYLANRMKKP